MVHRVVASAMRIPMATLLCCVYFFCIHVSVVSSLCLDYQRSLLLQLKNNLQLEYVVHSGKLVSWNQSIACCQWSGVTCDVGGQVIGLDLSGETISGRLDESTGLFSLQHLQNLNLADNNLNSKVPAKFNKLENLTHLNLSNAGFVGQIPIEISQLIKLVTLDISGFKSSKLKLENPSLRQLVRNLTKIRQLYLDGVNMSAEGQEWQAALLQIPTLQEVSMSDCSLSGPLHYSSLTRLENLSVIRLDLNNFSSPVPETFSNFKNLTTLSLAYCGLTGVFPQKIFQVRTLSFIKISNNNDLHGFLPEFPLDGSLHTLIVSKTNFSGPIPDSIGNLRLLSTLDLSESRFNQTLPNALSNLTQLVEVHLSSNRFVGPIPSFGMCKKIQRLILYDNYLTGVIQSTHFEGLVHLTVIDLENNLFSGKVPSSLFRLPSLRSVVLSNNKFDGKLNDFINASSKIQELDLSGNHLEGPLPITLFQLRELNSLILFSNKLSGTVDLNMFKQLGNLATLDLSYNNLSTIDTTTALSLSPSLPILDTVSLASCKLTTFPQFLKNQSLLSHLDLSYNHIAGTIPRWISNINVLLRLNLSHNYLIDWEEPSLNNLSFLLILDLHSNHIQGPLVALPQALSYLDYSTNELHGSIPHSICTAPRLQVLDLSNNALTGTIPDCMTPISGTLTILDLGRNKLSGTIPTFRGSCGLRTLHLNGNSLQGKLPKHLVKCNMLEVLDLGQNQIHDLFPCWWKRISTLRVLILRSNKLHGSLKCPGTMHRPWPRLQIVDLASNNFGGNIPVSLFDPWKAMMADKNHDGSLSKPNHLQFLTLDQVYYQDRVSVTSKEQQMELVKILTIFTAVDLSCNKFEGVIPDGLGQLNALYILNLSHNAFSGHIPSSIGNMKFLESLDMSNNNLSGEIPTQLVSLSFLSVLNLSYNHLVGRIPTGTQLQSFEPTSFIGNDGLCGSPLTPNCSGDGVQPRPPLASRSKTDSKSSIEWNFISAEMGFAFGIGIVIFPIMFRKSWRIWYWEHVDNILYRIFPQLDFVYECVGGKTYRTLRWKS